MKATPWKLPECPKMRNLLTFYLLLATAPFLIAQEPLTLKQALQAAKNYNPALKAQRFNIKMAEADVLTAKLRPNLSLSHESLQMLEWAEFAPQTSWYHNQNREVLWELSKPIQIAGQRKNKIEVAQKSFELEENSYLETERELLLEVATKWLDVWAAQKQLQLLRKAKKNTDSLVYTNQVRYRNQVITHTDVLRAELLAKSYTLLYKTASKEAENLQSELGLLLGKKQLIRVDTTDNLLPDIPIDIDVLLKSSLENRSDVRATKSLKEVAESNRKLQRSLAYPEPEVGIIYNSQHSVPHFGLSFSVDLPFFDRNQGEIQKSNYLQEQAEQYLSALHTQIQNEVVIAYSNFQLQQENISEFEQLLKQAQQILDNVRHAYLRGGTTILDYLEAQRSWLETQQEFLETMYAYRLSYVQLLYSTGFINQLAL